MAGGAPGPALPCLIHDQRHGDDAVRDEGAEILADHGVARDGGASSGGHDEHQVEQEHAQEGVADGGLLHRGTAHQQRGDAEGTDLGVCAVSGEIAQVLQIDDHAEARQHGGHDDGDDAGAVHVDAGIAGHFHILRHSPHVLAQLGPAEPDDHQAEHADDEEREHRDLDACHIDGQQVVQMLPHVQQADGIADAIAPGQLQGVMNDGDDGPHHEEHDQLIHAVHEEGDDIAGDHLPALCLVQQVAAEDAEEDGDGDGDDHRQNDAGDAPDLPVGHQDQADLTRHGAQRHGKVHAQARHNGDEQAEDQEGVAAHAGDQLVEQIGRGIAGHGEADDADHDEHDGDNVVLQQSAQVEFRALIVLHLEPSPFITLVSA